MAIKTSELPLFPLNLVLFPGMVLPLHIFEERYKLMIRTCLEEGMPFGVVLARSNRTLHPTNQIGVPLQLPHTIGTTALITEVERLSDGRMNIITVGQERFRVQDFRHNRPYLVGNVESYPPTTQESLLSLYNKKSFENHLHQYATLVREVTGQKIRLRHSPADLISLAYLAAIALQVKPEDKQKLLEAPTASSLLDATHRLLLREIRLLGIMQTTQDREAPGDDDSTTNFSMN
ncbi:MAG: LON peptidase substrate-binding domain-containing protein [Chloroflexi bacterium]|nr:LON peptidase substrate-binding domain-containing protein [Chloroflexota bacterium]